MSPTATDERELIHANRVHRHDATHRARHVARALREPSPLQVPNGFRPGAVDVLPEPARRWLRHAIEPGTLLFGALEIQMRGEIKLGRWRPFTATEAIVPDTGFVWSARTRLAGLPVRGFDSYTLGEGRMRWRLLGVLPLMSATGYDCTRSAAGRLTAEATLLPTSLVTATWRRGPDDDSATYLRHFGHRIARGRATIHVAPDGQLRSVTTRRWGNPCGHGYGEHPFEVTFGGEYGVDGILIPDLWAAAWLDSDGRRQEFFRASIDAADFLLAGRRS